MIHVIGGGLAGTEAAWQAAELGASVVVHEMRPVASTAVHRTDRLAELVCSNSFRGDKLDNAVGLLKAEMRRLGSIVMRAADAARVPAGAALAVDREGFSRLVTDAIENHPRIRLVREEVQTIPDASAASPVILATGPLTSAVALGRDRSARRPRAPVLLRCHQPHRSRGEYRCANGFSRLALGPKPSPGPARQRPLPWP